MKRFTAVFVIFLGSLLPVPAQSLSDSLEKLEKQETNERGRAAMSVRIIRAKLQANDTTDLRARIGNTAQMAEKLKDSVLLYYVLIGKGDLQFISRKTHRGFDDYFRAFQVARGMGIDSITADAYYNLGYRNYLLGNYVPALDKLLRARDRYERLGNGYKVAFINRLCGVIHLTMGSLNEALQLFNESKQFWQKTHDDKNLAATLNNIGLTYMNLGDSLKSMEFFYQSLVIREKIDDKVGMGQVCNNIGTLMFKLGHYEKALSYFKRGYDLRRNNNGPRQGQLESLVNIGKAHFYNNELTEGREYLESVYSMSMEDGNIELQRRALDVLKDLYLKAGEPKKAFEAQKEFYSLRDSLFSHEKTEDLIRLSTAQEYERKMLEDSLKTAEKERQEKTLNEEKDKRQSVIRNAMLAGLILLLGIAFLLYKRNREKKLANEIITLQRDELSMKQVEITDSINYAKRIQEAIQPGNELRKRLFPDSFMLLLPRDIVSGDFYWFTEKDGKKLVAAVDCTGHGVPGAFMSMIGNAFLNEIVNEKGITDPGQVLDHLRSHVIKSLKQTGAPGENKDGMDIAICAIDEQQRTLAFAGANNPLWLIRAGKLIALKPDKQPIGVPSGELKKFSSQTIALEPGDCIYIFTDGYADQFGGPKGKKFKYRPMQEMLLSIHDKKMEEQISFILRKLLEWKGNLDQIDDILVIGIRA